MLNRMQRKNKKLVERYPFLLPRDVFTYEPLEDYDYSWTELDDMPNGWKKAFGEQMCKEICEDLKASNIKDYRILQIKEKYGTLRWYGSVETDRLCGIIHKYENLSMVTCISCGKPAAKISKGWISPFCDKCAKKMKNVQFTSIGEYIKAKEE